MLNTGGRKQDGRAWMRGMHCTQPICDRRVRRSSAVFSQASVQEIGIQSHVVRLPVARHSSLQDLRQIWGQLADRRNMMALTSDAPRPNLSGASTGIQPIQDPASIDRRSRRFVQQEQIYGFSVKCTQAAVKA
jgi:hypothetical protein